MNLQLVINYDGDQPTVSARNLYRSLEIEKRFSAWFETNSVGFVEKEDYTSVLQVRLLIMVLKGSYKITV